MIAVHVGDKNAGELGEFELAAQKLVLGSFSAVKEPEFGPLGQPQRHTRHVARSRWHTGTGSKKSDLHKNSLTSRMIPILPYFCTGLGRSLKKITLFGFWGIFL
jgi:hypothetical protein